MGGASVWFLVYIRGGWEKRSMVTHEKANGWWELQGSMKHDELNNMERLGCPWGKGFIRGTSPTFERLPITTKQS